MGGVTIGVDIGQRHDPTAIAVADAQTREVEGVRELHFLVRHLERLELGTPYPDVARRIAEVSAGVLRLLDVGAPRVYIDATGVGQPVVDTLVEAGLSSVVPVYFTHGDRRSSREDGSVSLGKAWLVSRLQVLLQTRRLHLPRGHPEAGALTDELLNYEIRVSQNANDAYGAFKVGVHDDLVTAVGLATQESRHGGAHLYALPDWGDEDEEARAGRTILGPVTGMEF